jgi:hypothetical protein
VTYQLVEWSKNSKNWAAFCLKFLPWTVSTLSTWVSARQGYALLTDTFPPPKIVGQNAPTLAGITPGNIFRLLAIDTMFTLRHNILPPPLSPPQNGPRGNGGVPPKLLMSGRIWPPHWAAWLAAPCRTCTSFTSTSPTTILSYSM